MEILYGKDSGTSTVFRASILATLVQSEMIEHCIVDNRFTYYCIIKNGYSKNIFNDEVSKLFSRKNIQIIFIDKIEDYPHLEYLL